MGMAKLTTFTGQVEAAVGMEMLYDQTRVAWNSGDVRTRANIIGNVTGEIVLGFLASKGTSALVKGGAAGRMLTMEMRTAGFSSRGAKEGSTTLYRAVSKAELDDIAEFGFRNKPGAYETGKLFAPTLEEAAKFGKNNFMFDGLPNTIMKVRAPNSVMNNAYRFGADGMNAISIPTNQFNLLKAKPLKYSPLIR